MLTKTLLPLAVAFAFSPAALAQPAGHPGAWDRQQTVKSLQREEQARIRSAWVASGHKLNTPDAPPTLSNGSVLVKNLDVAHPPASPAVKLSFQTDVSGLASIYVYFYSQTSDQFQVVSFTTVAHTPPLTSATLTLQSTNGACYYFCGEFNEYAAAGDWVISSISVCDNAFNCTYYDTSDELAALFPHGYTVTLTNNGTPDVTPPLVTAGRVLTRRVSLSSPAPDFGASLTVSDDISGVYDVYVNVCPPNGATGSCVGAYTYVSAPLQNGTIKSYNWLCYSTFNDCSQTALGKWKIHEFGVCDLVRNCVYDFDAADIQALFGSDTFKVVP